MSTCFLFNPHSSDDWDERWRTLQSLCRVAEISNCEVHPATSYQAFCAAIVNYEGAPVVLFVHHRDIGENVDNDIDNRAANLVEDVGSWPGSVYAIVYSGEPVTGEPPLEKRVKCLKSSYPIDSGSYRFKLLVRAMKAAAAGDLGGFEQIDINDIIVPRVVRIWEDLDIVLQALQAGIPLDAISETALVHVKEALKGEPKDFSGLLAKYFKGLDLHVRQGIKDYLCPSGQPSPLLLIHTALATGEEFPPSLRTGDMIHKARDCFARVRVCVCELSES